MGRIVQDPQEPIVGLLLGLHCSGGSGVEGSVAHLITTYTKEMSTFRPTIKMRNNEFDLLYDEGDEFKFSDTPRLLGVILDKQLCFEPHVTEVIAVATKKSKMLYALRGSDWGWSKKDLRMIYLAFCRSKMMYAASAWQSWLSCTQVERLEVAQNKAGRAITGQYSGSPK